MQTKHLRSPFHIYCSLEYAVLKFSNEVFLRSSTYEIYETKESVEEMMGYLSYKSENSPVDLFEVTNIFC